MYEDTILQNSNSGVVARRDTGKFLGGPLESEFVKPRKMFNMNKILGEKSPHLHVDSSSQFRIRGGQHIQTGPCERDAWNINRAAKRGTSRENCPRASRFKWALKASIGAQKSMPKNFETL